MRRLIGGRQCSRGWFGGRPRLYAAVALLATCNPVLAQPVEDAPGRVETAAADTKAYLTAPLHAERPQWVRFGAALGAIAFAHHYDGEVRNHFETITAPSGTTPETHDGRDAAPAVLALGGTWIAAVLGDDDEGRHEAGAMFEAAALSGAAGVVLKRIVQRERPFTTADDDAWGEDGDAFPSLHTTAAFAIGTVLAESGSERYRWLRRALGYGLAVHTAYARMDHDAHWLSDTVAGAALGIATARFVMKRREGERERASLALAPSPDGVALSYTVPLRR